MSNGHGNGDGGVAVANPSGIEAAPAVAAEASITANSNSNSSSSSPQHIPSTNHANGDIGGGSKHNPAAAASSSSSLPTTLYELNPPLTTGDKGIPSASINKDAQRVFHFVEDERHLVALRLLESVEERIRIWEDQRDNPNRGDHEHQHHGHGHRFLGHALKKIRHHTTGSDHLSAAAAQNEAYMEAKQILENNSKRIDVLRERCRLFRQAQRNLQVNDSTDSKCIGQHCWTFASKHFGVTTCYRREKDGTLSIRLEGELNDVPLFEQVCVLREIDLHSTWAPFCSSSLTVAELDKLDVVGWFLIGMPHFGLARDGCFRALGCDNIAEDGTILLAAQGIHDKPSPRTTGANVSSPSNNSGEDLTTKTSTPTESQIPSYGGTSAPISDDPAVEATPFSFFRDDDVQIQQLEENSFIPDRPKRRGSGRVTIRTFQAMIKVNSPTSCTTRIVANIDPNLNFLPQSLLDFILKHLAGAMLAKLQMAAKKACTQNPAFNPHARRMRQRRAFYEGWLMPKFQAICRDKGWIMPDVKALDFIYEEESASSHGGGNAASSTATAQNQMQTYYQNPLRKRPRGRASTYDCGPTARATSYGMDIQGGNNTMEKFAEAEDVLQHSYLDSLSAVDGAEYEIRSHDEVSELTARSNFTNVFNNNPIKAYLQEMEAKTERVKAAKIAAQRRKAAARLKPKDLSYEEKERLDALKQAKERLLQSKQQKLKRYSTSPAAIKTTMTSSGSSCNGDVNRDASVGNKSRSRTLSQRITARLHSHDQMTRFFVEFFLISVLFALLNPHAVFQQKFRQSPISSISFEHDTQTSFWVLVGENILATIYILICSVSHFVTCDVAMVYAFGSLHLGQLSALGVRQYYTDNVRIAVAIASLGMAALSITKAIAKVLLQVMICIAVRVYALVENKFVLLWHRDEVQEYENAVESIKSLLTKYFPTVLCSFVSHCIALGIRFVVFLMKILHACILRSNALGRSLESAFGVFLRASLKHWDKFIQSTVDENVKIMSIHSMMSSWRKEAFDTIRTLFSYTSVFLIVFLILFNLSAKTSRRRKDQGQSRSNSMGFSNTSDEKLTQSSGTNDISNAHALKGQLSNLSSMSDDFNDDVRNKAKVTLSNAARARAATYSHAVAIPEERELSPSPTSPEKFFLPDEEDSSGSDKRATKHSNRLRFRGKKIINFLGTEKNSVGVSYSGAASEKQLRKSMTC